MLDTGRVKIESSLLMSASYMRESWFVLFGTLCATALLMLAICAAGPVAHPGALQGDETNQALKNTLTPVPLALCTAQQTREALAAVPPYVPLGTGDFVSVSSGGFVSGGQAFRIRGVNYFPARAPWRRFLTASDPVEVAKELDLIRATGFNTLRIFLWYDALFDCPGSQAVPEPDAFARLDAILKLAADRGFRLIVTLNDLPDLSNYPLYTKPETAAAQTAYIISRYRDEPAILAWDVRNEGDLDYRQGGFAPPIVLNWLAQTAAQIRRIDPNHLITAGWSGDAQATENVVDFLSFHHYLSQGFIGPRIASLKAGTKKPIVLEETGFSTFGGGEALQSFLLQATLAAAEDSDLGGWLVWTAFDFTTDVTCVPPACPDKESQQHHYGLWRADYTPKWAAGMIQVFLASRTSNW
jgi:endo-1,4-beta-mannosidase